MKPAESCEMCGCETQLMKAKVESVLMSVCKSCSRFGNVVLVDKPIKKVKKIIKKMEKRTEEVVPDYSRIVKEGREKLKLTHKELGKKIAEKISVIHNIESHKLVPSLRLARKIEGCLGIQLIDDLSKNDKVNLNFKEEGLTIGDLIKTRKRK